MIILFSVAGERGLLQSAEDLREKIKAPTPTLRKEFSLWRAFQLETVNGLLLKLPACPTLWTRQFLKSIKPQYLTINLSVSARLCIYTEKVERFYSNFYQLKWHKAKKQLP